jgi:Protein of unknown function (DUF3667)
LKPHLQAAAQGVPRAVASGHCHNCTAAVSGNFCAACGQETVLHVASAREFFHEFIGHYVALEGKLWKTLGLLLFRPGRLTAEYIAGRRARYVQPLRIYLTLSILFFALLKYGPVEFFKVEPAVPEASLSASAPAAPQPSKPGNITTKLGGTNPAWEARIQQIAALPAGELTKLLKNTFFIYVPYALFFIMPVFALYLKLLYLGSGRRYGEHMLFALHSNGFAFLLLGLIWVTPWTLAETTLFAWLVLYLPIAMRRVYGGSRRATAVRWIVLMTAYMATVAAVLVGTMFTATVVIRA